jgi:EmrB/QacA subfamily drug resistance transporter
VGLSSRQVWFVVGGLLLGTFLAGMDTLVTITALPTIVGDLGGANRISWVITAYLLASTACAPIYGKLGDMWGRKRLYQFAIALFLIGSILSGLAQNVNELIGARALQGLGAGGIMSLALAIIGDVASPRERGRYQGVMGISSTAATVIGPLVGGFLVDHVSWRYIFFINLPFGAMALVAASRLRLPARPKSRVRIDIAGSLLLVSATACAILAITWGGSTYGWSSPTIIGLGMAVVVLAVWFVAHERRAREPLFPPRLFRNQVFSVASVGGFLSGIAMFGPWVIMPIFLQVVVGTTATNSGLLLLPLMVTLSVTSIISGRLVTRWGRYKVFPIVGMLFALLGFFLYATMGVGTTFFTACLFMVATGFGLGMLLQMLVTIVQGATEYRDLGVATAGVSYFRQLGGSLGTAISLSVFDDNFRRNVKGLVASAHLNASALGGSPAAIRKLAPAVRRPLIEAYARSLHVAFVYTIPPAVLALVVFLFLKEAPLSSRMPLVEGEPPTDRTILGSVPA